MRRTSRTHPLQTSSETPTYRDDNKRAELPVTYSTLHKSWKCTETHKFLFYNVHSVFGVFSSFCGKQSRKTRVRITVLWVSWKRKNISLLFLFVQTRKYTAASATITIHEKRINVDDILKLKFPILFPTLPIKKNKSERKKDLENKVTELITEN